MITRGTVVVLSALAGFAGAAGANGVLTSTRSRPTPLGPGAHVRSATAAAPRNVIIILSDDHRFDFLGFMPGAPKWLQTPNLDRMRREGAHLRNAFVTTSLCSPSRASILTGQYAHRHGVVDNSSPIPVGTVFFPEYLQRAGYRTGYIGKWHMGEDAGSDQPRKGFDHWISFRGQGSYTDPVLNVNGTRASLSGYTTDILTDSALAFIRRQRNAPGAKPYFLVLSHKATHAEFVPAPRHAGRFANEPIPYPVTMANTEANARGKPRWVLEQRNSWHGVDYAYHGALNFDQFYRMYAETLMSLDESVGRVLDEVRREGANGSTLVLYMSDNGFALGEHGLIDKRHAYEESMRIPMLAWSPGFITAGSTIQTAVRNTDVAPTVMELAGAELAQRHVRDGRSVLTALQGRDTGAPAGEFLYEYYWEYAFPHTPTTFALRGERFKYIAYHGLWDINELYDLQTDSLEQHNLIDVPAFRDTVRLMRNRLFDRLEKSNGMFVPLRRGDWQAAERRKR